MTFDPAEAAQPADKPLKRGWTTGACATAATKAALTALLTGAFPDPVAILLPKGERPAFPLARQRSGDGEASAAIVKDAGDDPDVTHLAEVSATVRLLPAGAGIVFRAGAGVGTVTLPGLPIPPGEPAINPVPRQLMRAVAQELCAAHGRPTDVEITIGVANGEALAKRTWNGRLGIHGGLSILGTTGIVHPFSCAAWIHSIHRGVDVAWSTGLGHVVGSTGSTSEDAARRLYPDLGTAAFLDMGDFAGGLLKYLRAHPVPRVTVAGGFAKLAKLGAGAMDLHSGRSQVDFEFLTRLVAAIDPALGFRLEGDIKHANTAKAVLDLVQNEGVDLGRAVADAALGTVRDVLRGAPVEAEILVIDRAGAVIGHAS